MWAFELNGLGGGAGRQVGGQVDRQAERHTSRPVSSLHRILCYIALYCTVPYPAFSSFYVEMYSVCSAG